MRRLLCQYWLPVGLALFILAACQSGAETREATAPEAARPGAAVPASSAPPAKTTPPTTGQEVTAFVPAGYQVETESSGDLNRDAWPDKVVVLRKQDADTTTMGDETPRPLLLLLGQGGPRYTLAARNDSVVLCTGCGGMMGDPFQGITIKNGFFSLEYYGGSGWRWTRVTTFRYDPAQRTWFLHREGGESFHAADPEKVETHMRTTRDFGRVAFADYRSGDDL